MNTTCKDCIHYPVCAECNPGMVDAFGEDSTLEPDGLCKHFEDKSRFIELPCAVGDVVYDICTIFDESTLQPKKIIKPRVIDFVSSGGLIIESKGLVLGEKDFGRHIFLTKEDAEKALKGGAE